jgi:hypothetical protein
MLSWDEIIQASLRPGTLVNKAFAARKKGPAAYDEFYKSCTAKERTALVAIAKAEAAEMRRVLSMRPEEQIANLNRDPESDAYTAFSKLIERTQERLGRGAAHRVFAKWKDVLEHKLDLKNEMLMRLLKAMPQPNIAALAREIALENEELPKEKQKGWGSTNETDIRRRLQELLQDHRTT